MKHLEDRYKEALSAFQAGDYSLAKSQCLRVIKKNKRFIAALHLLALIYKQENNFLESKKFFELALDIEPKQLVILSNFANLHVQFGEFEKAGKIYQKVIYLDENQVEAWYNWALCLHKQERFNDSLEALNNIIKRDQSQAKYFILLGIVFREIDDFESSILNFEKALEISENNPELILNATQNMAVTYRVMHKPESATRILSGLLEKNIASPQVHFLKACAHYDASEFDAAERNLKAAINLNPEYIEAHEALNKLFWEQSDDSRFLTSYSESLTKLPNSLSLYSSYVMQLVRSEQYQLAEVVLDTAINNIGPDVSLIHARAAIKKRIGDITGANLNLDRALKLQPNNVGIRIDKANLLVQSSDYKAALSHLKIANKIDPLNQEVWAYIGLCWRLLDNAQAEWLNDYKSLVNVRELDVPIGYDNLEHFMHELRIAVDVRHKTNRQPLDQSVKNGTQTVGKLLALQDKVIQDYKIVLSASIQEYINELPIDSTHPFLSRNTKKYTHTGSWSVKLKSGGYHTNHMHPQGWLSNCTYVSLPKIITEHDVNKAGWIKFGETSLELNGREQIAKTICPKVGMRILFPSFMWHGTNPFESNEYRVTLPSDISPKF